MQYSYNFSEFLEAELISKYIWCHRPISSRSLTGRLANSAISPLFVDRFGCSLQFLQPRIWQEAIYDGWSEKAELLWSCWPCFFLKVVDKKEFWLCNKFPNRSWRLVWDRHVCVCEWMNFQDRTELLAWQLMPVARLHYNQGWKYLTYYFFFLLN